MTDRAGVWMTADEAVACIRPGDRVGLGQMGAEPLALGQALWQRAGSLHDVTIVTGMLVSGYGFLSLPDTPFRLRTWFMPGTMLGRDLDKASVEYMPMGWTQTARWLESGGIDVALIQVAPADADGFHSLGISGSLTLPMARGARRAVVAQVNAAMPRVAGPARLHRREIDILVSADAPLLPFPTRPTTPADTAVAYQAATLVPDGVWLQAGIGGVPAALVETLAAQGRRNLRILSQIGDAGRALIEAGACADDGPAALIGEVMGSTALYAWADGNPALQLVPATQTHAIESFVNRGPVVCANAALEVDLSGQINTEFLDGRQAGAIGGAIDFAMAAQVQGNLALTMLTSRTAKGVPRIVPALGPGPTTIPRVLAQIVVTEQGRADLRGLDVAERARALAAIAHPDDRDALLRHATAHH